MYTLKSIEIKKDGSDDWVVDYVEITDKQKRRTFMFKIDGKVTSTSMQYFPDSITWAGNTLCNTQYSSFLIL